MAFETVGIAPPLSRSAFEIASFVAILALNDGLFRPISA